MSRRPLASTASMTRRRPWLLALLGLSALALLACLMLAIQARAALSDSARQLVEARGQERQAQLNLRRAELQARIAVAAAQLGEQAQRLGLDEGGWLERRTALRQVRLSRAEATNLLLASARGPSRLFGAQEFELSVTRPEEGLFNLPQAEDAPLSLTLRGSALIRVPAPGERS